VTVAQDVAAAEQRVLRLGDDVGEQRVLPIAGEAGQRTADGAAFARALRGGFDGLIERESRAAGLDPALVDAVVSAESAFDPRATSAAGAAGLMQLMPATAAALGVTDRYDPVQNVRAGATYLHALLERFGSLPLAVAAYNAGPAAVERSGGVPPFAETRDYVGRVLAAYRTVAER
jgi:soluble lytic murein transglycosylase-like protein